MSKEKEILEYDEDASVQFIQNQLPEEMKKKLSGDDINYIIDLVYEFYETEGFLHEDESNSVEIDEEQLLDFVIHNVKKDGLKQFSDEEIEAVVTGELEYCDTLNIFD